MTKVKCTNEACGRSFDAALRGPDFVRVIVLIGAMLIITSGVAQATTESAVTHSSLAAPVIINKPAGPRPVPFTAGSRMFLEADPWPLDVCLEIDQIWICGRDASKTAVVWVQTSKPPLNYVPLPTERPNVEYLTAVTIYWLSGPVPPNIRGLHGNEAFASLDECRKFGAEKLQTLRKEANLPRATFLCLQNNGQAYAEWTGGEWRERIPAPRPAPVAAKVDEVRPPINSLIDSVRHW